jgi:molecular chaperone HtpG
MCVQGIRVTGEVPGWSDAPVVLVDISGLDAPKTNVARTDLEAGPALDALIESVYTAVLESVHTQIPELESRASLRYALKEAHHLFAQATRGDGSPAYNKPKAMRKVLSSFALHPVEANSVLESRSVDQLRETGFSVLIGPAAEDAARFMDWLPAPKGMMAILRDGGLLTDVEENTLPLLGGREPLFAYHEHLWDSFHVAGLRALEGGRSVILDFSPSTDSWVGDPFGQPFASAVNMLLGIFDRGRFARRRDYNNYYCLDDEIEFSELPNEASIVFVGTNRLFGPTSLFSSLRAKVKESSEPNVAIAAAALYMIANEVSPAPARQPDAEDLAFVASFETWLTASDQDSIPFRAELIELLRSAVTIPVWSTLTAWRRREDRFPN